MAGVVVVAVVLVTTLGGSARDFVASKAAIGTWACETRRGDYEVRIGDGTFEFYALPVSHENVAAQGTWSIVGGDAVIEAEVGFGDDSGSGLEGNVTKENYRVSDFAELSQATDEIRGQLSYSDELKRLRADIDVRSASEVALRFDDPWGDRPLDEMVCSKE